MTARTKAKKAEQTSDLNSSEFETDVPSKRKRFRKTLSSSDDSTSDDEVLPPPPAVKSMKTLGMLIIFVQW